MIAGSNINRESESFDLLSGASASLLHTVRQGALLTVMLCQLLSLNLMALGHTTTAFEALDYVSYVAPFGYDETETYTSVAAEGNYAYLGSLSSGIAIIDVSNPSSMSTATVFGSTLNKEFHDLIVEDGIGYFSTKTNGTYIVDLSTPTNPSTLTQINSGSGGYNAVTNTYLYDEYLFQVSESSSNISVFDISSPSSPSFVTNINTGDVTGIYDLSIVEDRIYAAGLGGTTGNGAVYLYDLNTKEGFSTQLVSEITTGENTASASPSVEGDKLLVSHLEVGGTLDAWDIRNPNNPRLLDSTDASDLEVSSYSAGQITTHGSVAYVSWLQAGVQVIDIDLLDTYETIYRVGAFGTSTDSPLAGLTGNQSIAIASHSEVYLADSRWGLYQVDATNVVSATTLSGDFNNDGVVDSADYCLWRDSYGTEVPSYTFADANGDGFVDEADYNAWVDSYGQTSFVSSAALSVPEPTSLIIFLFAGLAVLRARDI